MKPATLITGASSGIGLEFAHVLDSEYAQDIVLVARRRDRLEKLKEILLKKNLSRDVHVLPTDLTDRSQRLYLRNYIKENDLFVQTLVNNAGFGSYGYFNESKIDREREMLSLNCDAILDLTHAFLPEMLNQKSGVIINVSSVASFQGLPLVCTYAATKAFVTSFSLGLAAEIKGSGVQVQALCPGPVATEFVQVSGFPDQISFVPSISSRKVVELSVSKLKSGQRVVIPGFMNILLAQLNRLVPRAFASDIAKFVFSKKFTA